MKTAKTFAKFGFPAVLFIVGFGIALLAIQSWKNRTGATQAQPRTESIESSGGINKGKIEDIPGLNTGEVVALPELPTLNNINVALSKLKEKYLLCGFITASCPGCSRDSEFWKASAEEAHRRGVAFYLISIDTEPSDLKRFVQAYEVDNLPILFDPQHKAQQTFKIELVPQYILLTAEGKVIKRWMGVRGYDPEKQGAARVAQLFAPLSNP